MEDWKKVWGMGKANYRANICPLQMVLRYLIEISTNGTLELHGKTFTSSRVLLTYMKKNPLLFNAVHECARGCDSCMRRLCLHANSHEQNMEQKGVTALLEDQNKRDDHDGYKATQASSKRLFGFKMRVKQLFKK